MCAAVCGSWLEVKKTGYLAREPEKVNISHMIFFFFGLAYDTLILLWQKDEPVMVVTPSAKNRDPSM